MVDDFWGRHHTRRQPEKKTYDAAQICINGHVVTSAIIRFSEDMAPFCSECGAKTIITCQHCQFPIKGDFGHTTAVYERRAYCDNCGGPYPWTSASIEAAKELIQFSEQLNQTEKDDFKTSISDLMVETPKTKVAVAKFGAYAKKMGKEAATALREVVIEIASEAVKRTIWKE